MKCEMSFVVEVEEGRGIWVEVRTLEYNVRVIVKKLRILLVICLHSSYNTYK